MSFFLHKILHMSINGGILILAVLLVRLLFRRVPRRFFLVVWVFVLIRLLCPLSLSNPFSPVPAAFFGTEAAGEGFVLADESSEISVETAESRTEQDAPVVEKTVDSAELLFAIWLVGMATVLGTAGFKTVRLKKSVGNAVCYRENVYLCPDIKDSFVLGVIAPKIYIPSSVSREYLECIIDHEREHIRCKDHLLKFTFFIAMAVHWFNPLCHMAYGRFSDDLEMACDERTVGRRDAKYKAEYMQALLNCGSFSASLGMEALSFGSIGIKGRVERIMNDRKAGKLTLTAFATACAALAFFLMTNNVAMADSTDARGDIDYSRYTVIRNADGEVVEAIEAAEEGYLEPAAIPPHSITSSVQAEDLLLIKEEVLGEGVYRSPAKAGEPIFALCAGTVIAAGYDHGSGLGYCVSIADENGRIWQYGHCSELAAKEGDRVATGDLIAYAGTSGFTSEPAVIIRVVEQ